MAILLSEMSVHHYDQIVALWAGCEGIGEAETRDEIEAYLQRNPGFSVVACDGEALIGVAMCGHDGRRGYLYHVAVAPSHRSAGVGKQMVSRCLENLRAIGIPRCSIHLYADNEMGEVFWSRIGWRCRTDLKVMAFDISPS